MDAETALLLGVPVVLSIAIGVQHFYDRFAPNGLYKRTEQRTRTIPAAIGAEVENSFRRIYAEQEIKLKAEADAMMAQASQADRSLQMTMTGALGNAAQLQNKTTRMMAEAMLGQWLPALRMVLPSVAEQLEENPELIFGILDNPYFKKHVEPRIRGYLGDNNTAQLTSGAGGWVG